jgi:hypothetical protein
MEANLKNSAGLCGQVRRLIVRKMAQSLDFSCKNGNES